VWPRYIRDALEKPVLRDAVVSLLHGTALFLSQPSHPRGCLSIQAALACGVDSERIQQAMVEWRKAGEEALRKRFVKARRPGELPNDISPPTSRVTLRPLWPASTCRP
jgi:hypothetical protein